MIKQYVGNIFTHDKQSTVKGFALELPPVAAALRSVSPTLTVIYGYHGADPTGNWIRNFTADFKSKSTCPDAYT